MFYSHQLLARKASLGQIWMAATLHAKIHRRKLDQIDIIRVCEDILNPSVPMALRLSGILMGGVVIVYERKVKILYDDVNRLLVEINSAWKAKPSVDPTLLPKGKKQAKFEAVTLPENHDADCLNDVEQTIDSSNKFTSSATFHQTAYFTMRLDTIDELSENFIGKQPDEGLHQADPANITLDDPFDSYQADTSVFNRFERFDIEGDEETQINLASQRGGTEIPAPPETRPQKDDDIKVFPTEDDIPGQHVEDQANISSPKPREEPEDRQQPQEHLHKRKTGRRKAKQPPFIMDFGQTVIPSSMYQTWLQDSVDLQAKRPTIIEHVKEKSFVKLAQLVDLPPVALSCGLVGRYQEVQYPQPLLDLWMRSMQPLQDSPSGRTTSPHPPEPSSSSPTHGQGYQDPPNIPMGDFGNGFTSERLAPKERIRIDQETGTNVPITEFHIVNNNGMGTTTEPNASAGNSGTSARSFSVPSPVLGPNLSNTSDNYPGRLNNKRPSSTRLNSAGLESLDEKNQWVDAAAEHHLPSFSEWPQPGFKRTRHSQNGPNPDHEFLIQTGPTQTQRAAVDEEAEMMANNIKTHLKTYFEHPGAPQTESLNQLSFGMNRKQAAQLFYQTCVLATRDVLKVEQNSAYGDIIISKGAKM